MSAHRHKEFLREQTLRMSWFLVILFLSLTFSNVSEASHDKKIPSAAAAVVGTVYCDTCFQQKSSMGINHHFISGASVAVECKDGNVKTIFSKEVKTNEHGEFKVQLPFSVSKYERRIKGCTVKLVSSSEPRCAVASAATSSSLRLKTRKQGEHIFSAGFFSFKPLKEPNLCSQNPVVQNSRKLDSVKTVLPSNIDPSFPSPIQDPSIPGGLPNLPPLPGLPGLPPLTILPPLIPPAKDSNPSKFSQRTQASDQKMAHTEAIFPPLFPPIIPPLFPPIIPNPFEPPPLIPNPFQPPPLIPNPFQPPPAPLIPNPFQPPPAPLIPNPFQPPSPPPLIPNPFQPPSPPPIFRNPFQPPPSGPSPLFPFPPIPGLTPSPPPPPPPSIFPFPFPPLFPPPRSPGNPPDSSSESTSP